MYLTIYQQYILDCLQEIPYMRVQQLERLMQLKHSTTKAQLERHIKQLAYLGKITHHVDSGGFVSLPRQPRNFPLIMAVDVMAEVCGDGQPTFLRGDIPCLLSFYLRDDRGCLDFKVVPVPLGDEQLVLERLYRKYKNFKCTWLFLPESHAQIEMIETENPACFVFRNEAGGYDFLRKQ